MRAVLERYLADTRDRTEGYLRVKLEQLTGAPTPPRLREAMAYSVEAGGKRIRPVLCFAFAECVVPMTLPTVVDAACALELIHTYSLIHDDLPSMDDDDLRRGKPTSHKVFGEAMAILAGDALLTGAFELVATGDEPSRALLVRELASASGASGMVGGQVHDIAEDRPAELEYLTRLHRLKTGALFRAACRMGVIAAGGTSAQLEAATTYGDAVGLTFQIADDLLDVEATPAELGKATGADAAAGRATFPALLGVEGARRYGAEQVERATEATRLFERTAVPLAELARYALERRR